MRTDSLPERNIALDTLMPLIRQELSDGRSVRFAPRGISMLPMLRQGLDTVTISPLPPKLKKYDLPLYQRDDGKYVLHRIVRVEDTYTCIGDNQFEEETGVRHDQMIGLVTEFTRGEKPVSVKNWCYRLYCRIWHATRVPRLYWKKGIALLRRLVK